MQWLLKCPSEVLGALFFYFSAGWYCIQGGRVIAVAWATGTARGRFGVYDRRDSPRLFWLIIAFWIGMSAMMIFIAWGMTTVIVPNCITAIKA
jgi:hypothetical protein